MGKVASSWQELKTELLDARARGKKVVFTNGCFDILHVGHIRYLKEARSFGDLLVVGLNSDSSVRNLKGPERPIQDQASRAEILAALECVDYVSLFGEATPEALIREVRPDVLVKGGDYTIANIAGAPFVQSYGGSVRSLQFVEGVSTSALINRLKN